MQDSCSRGQILDSEFAKIIKFRGYTKDIYYYYFLATVFLLWTSFRFYTSFTYFASYIYIYIYLPPLFLLP